MMKIDFYTRRGTAKAAHAELVKGYATKVKMPTEYGYVEYCVNVYTPSRGIWYAIDPATGLAFGEGSTRAGAIRAAEKNAPALLGMSNYYPQLAEAWRELVRQAMEA